MNAPTTVSAISHLISLAIGPVFLLAGIGSILNVMAHRLGRVIDRARLLEGDFAHMTEGARLRIAAELRVLDLRMVVVQLAVGCCTASALFVCLLVAILFIAGLAGFAYARVIALLFVIAMAMLVIGLLLFLYEVNLAMRSLRVNRQLLAREPVA